VSTSGKMRYYGLDSVRVSMMMLVLIAHAGASYVDRPSQNWGNFHDAKYNHPFFEYLFLVINVFCMPVFFVLSGFFTALIIQQKGVRYMISNRFKRIFLPFVVFLILIFPIAYVGFRVAASGSLQQGEVAIRALLNGQVYWGLIHLWFMYYLWLLCIVAAGVLFVVNKLPAQWRQAGMALFERVATSRFYLLIPGFISYLALLQMYGPWTETPASFKPSPRMLLLFGIFFGYGWLLQHSRHLLQRFTVRPWLNTGLGLIFGIAYLLVLFNPQVFPTPAAYFATAMAMSASCMWTFIAGLIGLGLRHNNPTPFNTVLAQASYWIYLVHLPLAIWIPYALLDWQVSVFIKFGVTLTGILLLTFGSYLLLVRSTFIGRFLNGRTYPPIALKWLKLQTQSA